MKREDIEIEAKKEAEELACLVYYGGSAISQEDVENAFVKGAEWRIDSVLSVFGSHVCGTVVTFKTGILCSTF